MSFNECHWFSGAIRTKADRRCTICDISETSCAIHLCALCCTADIHPPGPLSTEGLTTRSRAIYHYILRLNVRVQAPPFRLSTTQGTGTHCRSGVDRWS